MTARSMPAVMALALALIFVGGRSEAARFCIVGAGLPPQCLYDDVSECVKASSPPEVTCVLDPAANLNISGGGRYCVVDSFGTAVCLYDDHGACNAAAGTAGDVCFDRSSQPDPNNPFRYDARLPF